MSHSLIPSEDLLKWGLRELGSTDLSYLEKKKFTEASEWKHLYGQIYWPVLSVVVKDWTSASTINILIYWTIQNKPI